MFFFLISSTARASTQPDAAFLQSIKSHRDAARRLIIKAVADKDPRVRVNAIEACVYMKRDAARKIVLNAIKDKHGAVRFVALVMMGDLRLKQGLPSAEKLLLQERANQRSWHRQLKPEQARLLQIRVRNQLRRKLKLSQTVEVGCLYALYLNGSKADISRLAMLLRSSDAGVRGNAVMVLGRMEDASAVPMIRQARLRKVDKADSQRNAIVQLQAAEAVAKLLTVKAGQSERDIIRANAFSSATPELRVMAVRAMGDLKDKAAISVLKTMLAKEKNPQDPKAMPVLTELQLAAAESLAKMGVYDGLGVVIEAIGSAKRLPPPQRVLWLSYVGRVLGEFKGNPQALKAVEALMKDAPLPVRIAAAMSILHLSEEISDQ